MKYLILLAYLVAIFLCFWMPFRLSPMLKLPEKIYSNLRRVCFSAGLWSLSVFLQLVLPVGWWTFFLHELKYLFICSLVFFACDFIFNITFISARFRKVNAFVQLFISACLLLFIASNNIHHLFRVDLVLDSFDGLHVIKSVNGPYYQYVSGYLYCALGFYVLTLFFMVLNLSSSYRRPYLILAFTTLVPVFISGLYQMGFFPFLIVDPVPFTFSALLLIYYKVIDQADILVFNPLKNSRIFSYITNPFLVVNRFGVVIDINLEGEELFSARSNEVIGRPIEEIIQRLSWKKDQRFCKKGTLYYRLEKLVMNNNDGSVLGTTYSFIDATKEYLYLEELEFLSFHDPLTGVYNMHYLHNTYVKNIDATNLPLGIIFSDANGLKRVNDCHGHEMGDKALIEMAGAIKSVLDPDEPLIRLGGDEFIIITKNARVDDLLHKEKMIRAAVMKESSYGLTISCGHAIYSSLNDDFKAFVAKADQMMYRAKSKYYQDIVPQDRE